MLFGLILAGGCALLGLYKAERRIWLALIAVAALAPAAFMEGLLAFAMDQAEQKVAVLQERVIPSLLDSINLPPPTTTPAPAAPGP